jgi:hypothetical protein
MNTSDEIFENHSDRLLNAEGKILALTHLVRELLSLMREHEPKRSELLHSVMNDPEIINIRLEMIRSAIAPDEAADDQTIKLSEAARALLGELISGSPPSRPTFTVIDGGKDQK